VIHLSNNQELLKRFAIVAFSLSLILSLGYALQEYLEQKPVPLNPDMLIATKTLPDVGQSSVAQFDPSPYGLYRWGHDCAGQA
jgi:hypothetical protein